MEDYTKKLLKKMETLSVEELKIGYLAHHLHQFKAKQHAFNYRRTEKGKESIRKSNSKRDTTVTICSCGRKVKTYNMKNHVLTKYHKKYDGNPRVVLDDYAFIGENI